MTTDENQEEEVTLDSLAVEEPEPEGGDGELPEKYQGKSQAELVQMIEETQKFVGRQANELGELRKAFDDRILANLEKAPAEEPVDFFENPEEAINRAIANHPVTKAAEQTNRAVAQATAKSQLLQAHPDATDIVTSPKFLEWRDSSNFRKQLWDQAQAYNAEAGIELITLYKERAGIAKQTDDLERRQRQQDVKKAATGSARGTGASPKKVYRRVDLIDLQKTNPERYQALASEIRQAYAEGRVK